MDDLIQKYIDDRCSSEELVIVLEWLKTPEGQETLGRKMDELWARENEQRNAAPDASSENSMRVSWSVTNSTDHRKQKALGRNYMKWSMLAAAVALFVIAYGTLFYSGGSSVEDAVASNPSLIVKQNPPGVKSTFQLPDGSVVKLNAGSELRFTGEFQGVREVFLSGEAFFEVAEDAEMPFVVRVSDLSVTALGTSFNINAFGDRPDIGVSLSDGKVKVEHLDQTTDVSTSVMLEPGEKAVFQKYGTTLSKQTFDPEIDLAWKNKILVFTASDFSEIKTRIERWYGVQVVIDPKLKTDWKFTGRFHNTSLESVMESVVYSRGLAFNIDKDQVKIYKPMK